MTADPRRTYHANQAVHLSDLINLKFSPERFGTDNPRYVRVTEPDGPSTDGGRKARQAIMLCAQSDPEDRGIVCGHIAILTQEAELRSYAYVKKQFETRFRRDIDISRGEYNRLLEKLQQFLMTQEYRSSILNTPRNGSFIQPAKSSSAPQATAAPISSGSGTWLAIALSFGFGFVTCYLLMRFQLIG